jgi:hypothetical protein
LTMSLADGLLARFFGRPLDGSVHWQCKRQ